MRVYRLNGEVVEVHTADQALFQIGKGEAIAQATERVGVFVTSPAPTIHPIMAAK